MPADWIDTDRTALDAALESERAARRLYEEARAELAAARQVIAQSADASRLVALEHVATLARELIGMGSDPHKGTPEEARAFWVRLAIALGRVDGLGPAPDVRDAPQGSTASARADL